MQRPRLPSAPTADFDGDGQADLTIYRVAGGASYWYQRFSRTEYATNASTQWGLSGDIKVPGDFDGDHKTDLAVFRPANGVWYILQSASRTVRQTHVRRPAATCRCPPTTMATAAPIRPCYRPE